MGRKLFRIYYLITVLLSYFTVYPKLRKYLKDANKYFYNLLKLRIIIARRSSKLSNIKFQMNEIEAIDWSKTYILCPNHTSNLDIPAMLLSIPQPFVFIGKKELLDNPVTHNFFKATDIPLDRKSKISSFKAFKKAAEFLDKNISVLIFPEGKIGDNYPPELTDFKSGPFKLAILKKVPILPIVIQNAWELCWDDGAKHGMKSGKIQIDFLSPIDTHNLEESDATHLKNQTYELIQKHWELYQN